MGGFRPLGSRPILSRRASRLAGSGARASVWAALTSVFVCGSGRRSAAVWRNTERRERALRALYAVASVCHFFR